MVPNDKPAALVTATAEPFIFQSNVPDLVTAFGWEEPWQSSLCTYIAPGVPMA